jgi:hypothetical protein
MKMVIGSSTVLAASEPSNLGASTKPSQEAVHPTAPLGLPWAAESDRRSTEPIGGLRDPTAASEYPPALAGG